MNYFEMYRDVWNFHKKYIEGICESEEFWKSVITEANDLSKKYQECKFMRNLLSNEINELNELFKEMRTDANTGV